MESDELLEDEAGEGDLILVGCGAVARDVDEEGCGRRREAASRVERRVEQVIAHKSAGVVGRNNGNVLPSGEARNEGLHGHRGSQGGAGGLALGDALLARHEATLVGNAKIRLIVPASLDAEGVGALEDAEVEEEKRPVAGGRVLAHTPREVALHGVGGRLQYLKFHVLGRQARNGLLGERSGQGVDEAQRRIVRDATELAKARHPDAGRALRGIGVRAPARSHRTDNRCSSAAMLLPCFHCPAPARCTTRSRVATCDTRTTFAWSKRVRPCTAG